MCEDSKDAITRLCSNHGWVPALILLVVSFALTMQARRYHTAVEKQLYTITQRLDEDRFDLKKNIQRLEAIDRELRFATDQRAVLSQAFAKSSTEAASAATAVVEKNPDTP